MTARLMYELLLGEMLLQEGQAPAAIDLMLDAARRTGEEPLYKRAADMAIQSRSGTAALGVARAWRQAFPASAQATQYELQVLIVLGRVADTPLPMQRFLAGLPESDKASFIAALPALFQRVPDKAEAARAVERGLSAVWQDKLLASAAWTSVGRLRLQAGDKPGALAAAVQGQAANPESEWPILLALQLYEADVSEAEALIQRYLRSAKAKPEVRISYARVLGEKSRTTQAHEQLSALIRQQPDYADAWLMQGALYADERNDEMAEAALRKYLDLVARETPEPDADRRPGADQARLMLARMAERRGDFAAAEQLLAVVESPEQALAVASRRAAMLARQGRVVQARQLIRDVPELQPADARMKLLAEAQLLRDHQHPQDAYDLLSEALQKDPDDDVLLYDAAMAAERLDRISDMERMLRRVIALKPESASAYNALGYTLADRGERLREAKQLIEKAVQLSPEDSFIQDSLGWVEFRLGNHQEALRLLQAAYRKRPDAEIAAHVGEVLWVMGERDAALNAWRDGLRLDPDNETLRKTLQRLKVQP